MGRRAKTREELSKQYGKLIEEVRAGASIRQAAMKQGICPSYAHRVLYRLGIRYKLIETFSDGSEGWAGPPEFNGD